MPVLYNQCLPYIPFIFVGEVLECCKLPSLCGDQQVDVAAMTQNSKLNQTFRKELPQNYFKYLRKELPQNCFKYFKKELPQNCFIYFRKEFLQNCFKQKKNFLKITNRKRTTSKLQIGKELPQKPNFLKKRNFPKYVQIFIRT